MIAGHSVRPAHSIRAWMPAKDLMLARQRGMSLNACLPEKRAEDTSLHDSREYVLSYRLGGDVGGGAECVLPGRQRRLSAGRCTWK